MNFPYLQSEADIDEFTAWVKSLKKRKVEGIFYFFLSMKFTHCDYRLVETQTSAIHSFWDNSVQIEDGSDSLGHYTVNYESE